jgi:hypothetical protein
MKLLRAIWQLLLVSVAMSFLIAGFNCEAGLLEEQDEEMLVVRVFAPLVEGENESLPIEGAQVYIWPEARLSGRSEEAEREFYQDGVTDENGVVVFNLSRSLYYFNASIYHVHASAIHYATPVCLVNITETWEVSVYLGESPKNMRVFPNEQTQPIFSNPYFVLVLVSTVAMGTAILTWSLKQRRAHTHKT